MHSNIVWAILKWKGRGLQGYHRNETYCPTFKSLHYLGDKRRHTHHIYHATWIRRTKELAWMHLFTYFLWLQFLFPLSGEKYWVIGGQMKLASSQQTTKEGPEWLCPLSLLGNWQIQNSLLSSIFAGPQNCLNICSFLYHSIHWVPSIPKSCS